MSRISKGMYTEYDDGVMRTVIALLYSWSYTLVGNLAESNDGEPACPDKNAMSLSP